MLTQEQIKNLKPGDPVIIHGTFERMATDGDICVKFPMSLRGFVDNNTKYAHPSAVSVCKHRYDPCRRFKKKDKVRVVQCNGRFFHDAGKYLFGAYCEVADDEEDDELIRVFHNSSEYHLDPAYLELVTPVEDMEPYYIEETEYEFCVTIMVGERKDSPAIYHKRMHPHAKEAAKAECERLNAEWRKEQNND